MAAAPFEDWHKPVSKSIRRPVMWGLTLLVLLGGGFGVWAATAPLASAVVASGIFVATGQNKIVQHLEGGVIREILVREGQSVEAGQPLIYLDDTSARAEVRRLEIKRATLVATKARLDAERADGVTVAYPDEILKLAAADGEVQKAVEAQNSVFAARRSEFDAQRNISDRQINAIEQEIEGLKFQKSSTEQQLALIVRELDAAESLYKKGLTELSRLLQLQRSKAKLDGDIGQYVSEIGKADQRILETKSEITHQRSKIIEDGANLYRDTAAELSDTEERLRTARGVLGRTTIVSPARGIIVKMQYHTASGVIAPGQQVLELLPIDDKLLVEAYVQPTDIDVVHVDLDAELRLTALNQRTTPAVVGKVVYVSADKVESKAREGQYYYVTRIALDEASLKKLGHVRVTPGMPAEVFIKTGERTMVEYILKPISDIMHRAGREQ